MVQAEIKKLADTTDNIRVSHDLQLQEIQEKLPKLDERDDELLDKQDELEIHVNEHY